MSAEIAVSNDLAAAHAVRRAVFIEEQGIGEADDLDGRDGEALHLLARLDGRPVGTARILVADGVGKIGRVAVLAECRGTGLGRGLILAALTELRRRGVATAKLRAQVDAVGFYTALGFEAVGPDYMDAGIPHRDMVRAP